MNIVFLSQSQFESQKSLFNAFIEIKIHNLSSIFVTNKHETPHPILTFNDQF